MELQTILWLMLLAIFVPLEVFWSNSWANRIFPGLRGKVVGFLAGAFWRSRRHVIWPLGWKIRHLRDRLARYLGGYRRP